MKKVFIICIVSIFMINLNAQKNLNALGIRLSDEVGFTYKRAIKPGTVIEGIAVIKKHSLLIDGLYEKYNPIPSFKSLSWFYGGGVFIGFWNSNGSGSTMAGLRGTVGLCYSFADIPIDASIDWMPRLQLIDQSNFDGNVFGLSLRYTF